MRAPQRQPVVHFPAEIEEQGFTGKLFGYYHADSNQYNVVSWGEPAESSSSSQPLMLVGEIIMDGGSTQPNPTQRLVGVKTDTGLTFHADGSLCRKEPYNLIQNIFSRNTGILETDVMLDKCVIISGCGSVGSLIALELARAGTGHFLLIDNDTVAYHNLCRHQCGIQDVGKFKVSAVKERILQTNPAAQVAVRPCILESVDKETFDTFCNPDSILIGCADNREGDVYGSTISCLYKIPFVSVGLWERAFAGEIFYSLPGEMPCYVCPFGGQSTNASGRTSSNRRIYTTQEDIALVNFEPGISTDIGFVTLIAVKLIMDILNRETPNYVPRLLNHLSQFTLVCNTNDPQLGGEQAEIFSYPLQVTTSVKVGYKPPCPPCKLL